MKHNCETDDRKLPIDRPCSACSEDPKMERHDHCPPFREPVPQVEAGDRALETARKIVQTLRSRLDTRWPVSHQQGWYEAANDLEKFIAEPIQSAMNAQEREIRNAVIEQCAKATRCYKCEAEIRGLLAERGGKQ